MKIRQPFLPPLRPRLRIRPRPYPWIPSRTALVALIPLWIAAGCGEDSTRPNPSETSQARFDGAVDPGRSSFVLSRAPGAPSDQSTIDVELVGSNLVTDPVTETVSLDVAIRNTSRTGVPAPAVVWLADFRPAGVEVLNADVLDPSDPDTDRPDRYGFDYSITFGPDNLLSPGETSSAKAWRFHVPNATGFSFSAVVTFGAAPPAVIAGLVFRDRDADGIRDPDEPPFFGRLVLTRPDGSTASTRATEEGRYRLPVYEVGLHTVTYEPPPVECACDVVVTTPNPLQIVVAPDEHGNPQSYRHADFGARIVPRGELPPIVLTDRSPDEIQQDAYRLLRIELSEDVLRMRVAFSGCGPDHDFTLFMSGGFMESYPVRARLVLGHDSFGELCDAAFERTLAFDLGPLRDAFERAYGTPGPVVLMLTDLQGNHHEFRYRWGPLPGENLLPNGSFERDGVPTLEGWDVANPALVSVVPGAAPDGGAFALRLEADWAPTTGLVRAAVPGIADGEVLRLSAWVRAEHGGGAMIYLSSGDWTSEPAVSEALEWSPVSLVTTVSISRGETLWVVLSSLHTEVMPRSGLVDRVVLERASELP